MENFITQEISIDIISLKTTQESPDAVHISVEITQVWSVIPLLNILFLYKTLVIE